MTDGGCTAPFEWKLAWELKELREAGPEERIGAAAAVLRELCRDVRETAGGLAGWLNPDGCGSLLILADRESPEQTAALLCVLRVLRAEEFAGAALFVLCDADERRALLLHGGRVLTIAPCRDEREAILAARRACGEALRPAEA